MEKPVTNVVKFPNAPTWVADVDARTLDGLIRKGYLKPHQRRNWCAVQMAVNNAFMACLFDSRPELSPQAVIEHMLKHTATKPLEQLTNLELSDAFEEALKGETTDRDVLSDEISRRECEGTWTEEDWKR